MLDSSKNYQKMYRGSSTMQSKLKTENLKNKRVILRADLNVPRKPDGTIANDFRIKAILPTIDLIQKNNGKIILLTHCGRPTQQEDNLSTKLFIDWFKKNGYLAIFAPTIEAAQELSKKKDLDIVIVENVRFWPEEKMNDTSFAKQLAALGDYYVNDAFGSLHKNDTSLTKLPEQFTPTERTIGLLVERELKELNSILKRTQSPFVVMQGGVKGTTKLLLLKTMFKKIDTILISTPLCFSFLKAQNKNVGNSFVEKDLVPEIKNFLQEAEKNNVTIVLPVDYQVSSKTFNEPHALREATTLAKEDTGISIGPKTAALFAAHLKTSKTVFINGLPGNSIYPETMEGTRTLLQALMHTNGTHIITGGDSINLVQQLGFDDVGYLSTGGGSTLAYLSGKTLPGLALFSHRRF